MHADFLDRFASQSRGFLRRLKSEGAVFTNARYHHAITETGPGHAVLLTGRHPRDTGIVANEWFDPLAVRIVNVMDDPASAPLPGPGRGASPVNLLQPTIG